MRILAIGCAAALSLAMASAGHAQNAPNSDTGSMAYPQSRATGQFQRSAPTGTDTGSMAYPGTQRQGQSSPGSQNTGADTGSMAYPAPRGAGTVQPNTTK